MRNAFAKEIENLAQKDERVVLLMGDIGNRLFNDFQAKFPSRFFNAGIAEANMITVAAGMASEGLRPYCYTIAPFVTARCYEQIKVDVGYHHQPVVLVGTGAGLSYAALGGTHHSLEDIALMQSIPDMNILCPGDVPELVGLLPLTLKSSSATYLRLGKKGEPQVHKDPPQLIIGKAFVIEEGSDICLLNTGNMLAVSKEVASRLKSKGQSVELASIHCIRPMDENYLTDAFKQFKMVVTIEEHQRFGGLGTLVAEIKADQTSSNCKLLRFSAPNKFHHTTSNQSEAREQLGLSSELIFNKITDNL